jgi:hypothetical protein
MKRIETRDEQERKDRRNKIIIGSVLAVVMLLSTLGYSLMSGEKTSSVVEKASYNGLDFYRQGDYWQTTISGNNFYFSYLPNETRKLNLARTLKDYSGKPLYYTDSGLGIGEIARNLGSFVTRVQKACIDYENCTEDIPAKNCSNNILIIREKYIGGNPVVLEENCVFIFSNDTVRDADAFLYRIFGIN